MSAARRLLDVLSGAPAADDDDGGDPPGTLTATMTRQNMFQTPHDVGITLRTAAEIADVAEGSIAARAGLRAGYYIVRVNGRHVETVEQVNTEFEKTLGVRIKALPMDDMEDILTKFHDAEEDLDWGLLLETTPRYSFLSPAHPLHLRWQARLEDARRAKQALRQLELEGAQEDLALLQSLTSGPPIVAPKDVATTAMPPRRHAAPAPNFASRGVLNPSAPAAIFSEGGAIVDEDDDVDEALMRKIVGAPTDSAAVASDPLPQIVAPPVALLAFIAQPYTLSNGTVVTCVVKARKGEKPPTPAEDPPAHLWAPPKPSAHTSEGDGDVSTSTAPRKSDKVRPQTLCMDYQRGRCHRSNCIYLHDDGRRRERKRSRDKKEKRRRSKSRDRSERRQRHR